VRATRPGRSGKHRLVKRKIPILPVDVKPKMTVWSAKMTVRGAGAVVAVVEVVVARAGMVV